MPTLPQGGLTGQSQGQIHSVFHERLTALRTAAAQAHNSLQGRHQRTWNIPTGLATALMQIGELHKPAFDRTAINNAYEQATADPKAAGTVGDVISCRLQIDYLAAEERAFRSRHCSLPRSFCLGHGRKYGQGQGKVWNETFGVEAAVASFIAAGGATPVTGAP